MVKKKTALLCAYSLCVKLQERFVLESIDDVSMVFRKNDTLYRFRIKPNDYNRGFIIGLIHCLLISHRIEVHEVKSPEDDDKKDVVSLSQIVLSGAEAGLPLHVNKRTKLEGIYSDLYDKLSNYIEDSYTDFVITYQSSNGENHKEVFEAITADDAFDLFRNKYKKYKEGVDYTFVDAFAQGKFKVEYEPEPKMVWSDSLDEEVIAGFSIEDDEEGTKHYTWNDDDCVYYWDEADDDYYMEVPNGAVVDM